MELKSLEDTNKFSKRISKIIRPGNTIFLYGEIGVGKTTFVRFLINELQYKSGVKKSDVLSPTFNIAYDYNIKKININHYDLYRIKNHKDILELGMFQTNTNYIKIIEWPELIKFKPKNRIEILFKYSKKNNFRDIKITGFGKWKDYKFNEV